MEQKLSYFSNFHYWGVKSVLKKQELKFPQKDGVRNLFIFRLTEKYVKEWSDLYAMDKDTHNLYLTYQWPWVIQGLMETLIPDLGVNLKNYLHLGEEGKFINSFTPGHEYIVTNRLLDVCGTDRNRIIIISGTTVREDTGKKIYTCKDYSWVGNISEKDMRLLQASSYYNQMSIDPVSQLGMRMKNPQLTNKKDYQVYNLHFHDKMGVRFGIVSGALNPTHTYKSISPLFGHKKPFVQGMCTGNVIIKAFTQDLGEKIDNCSMFFCGKIFLPQDLELRYNKTDYELFSRDNKVVAFGSRTHKSKSSAKKSA